MPKVVIAMSGGVDSSVAAALLKQQGHEVIGLMMRLWSEPGGGEARHNRCCTPDSMTQARRVAEMLDIPFYAVDAQETFRQRVVEFFTAGYAAGITPNPCLECNRHIRWDFLLRRAQALGAEFLATGHYARVRRGPAGWELLKGVDERKDQSYVLSVLGQAQLAHALFPLGDYLKPQVRELARGFGLPVAEREESQDLCFLADGDYRRFLRQHRADAVRPGPILRQDGTLIGEHTGLPNYTIGQRKGLGLAGPEPLYVLGLRPADNALIVGPASELGRDHLIARDVNWIAGPAPVEAVRAEVKIRYKAAPAWTTVTPLAGGRARAQFDQRLRDITPGQAAVFYHGEVCLGGGIIERTEP